MKFIASILRFLQWLLTPKAGIAVCLKFNDEKGKEITMLTIAADKKRTLTIAPVDAQGRPAKIDGVPVWEVSPTGGATLFPSADGLSCDVVWVAPLQQQIKVTGDADMGSGVKPIVGTLDIETLSPEAVGFTISAGPEVDNV